ALGFLLLLVALQAPLIALLGTLASLLSTAAAFGVARLVFQEGYGADLLGFESQGFLDAWAPVFFFAMIFAIAMDYTVFLLASAKEHYERSGDPKEAMVGGLAHSGRVILAAGAVMVAVFFTFALSGPLPPKEMGVILGVAVLLDAFLVRLVLMPVFLRLAGPAAWYLPAWLRRVLPDVSFGHGGGDARSSADARDGSAAGAVPAPADGDARSGAAAGEYPDLHAAPAAVTRADGAAVLDLRGSSSAFGRRAQDTGRQARDDPEGQ
ncbi:MAG TPA: MMPL family transporter, partial [Solirubrobacterales bacterium]|nr:MMPL family transporter [Solirubrobacterales bacterium]